MAIVLTPGPTVRSWLAALDAQIARAPGFFDDRPVVLDVAMLAADEPDVAALIPALLSRGVNVIGTEGAHAAWTGLGVPALPATTRPLRMFAIPDAPEQSAAKPAAPPPPPAAPEPTSLLVDRPVRSGQSVGFDRGDVTVVGTVASGAEVFAGGSIHVYGALRGRAVAGLLTGAEARIFCGRMEAELIAIGGIYLTADQMPRNMRGRAVQARLDQHSILLAPLD